MLCYGGLGVPGEWPGGCVAVQKLLPACQTASWWLSYQFLPTHRPNHSPTQFLQAKAGMAGAVAERLTACSNELSKGRKKRVVSPTGEQPATLIQTQQCLQHLFGGFLWGSLSRRCFRAAAADGAAAGCVAQCRGWHVVLVLSSSLLHCPAPPCLPACSGDPRGAGGLCAAELAAAAQDEQGALQQPWITLGQRLGRPGSPGPCLRPAFWLPAAMHCLVSLSHLYCPLTHTCAATPPVPPVPQGGILALDLSPTGEAVVATAGGDSTVQLFDRAAERVLASLTGHSKKVYGEWEGAAAWAKLGGHCRAGWQAGRLGSHRLGCELHCSHSGRPPEFIIIPACVFPNPCRRQVCGQPGGAGLWLCRQDDEAVAGRGGQVQLRAHLQVGGGLMAAGLGWLGWLGWARWMAGLGCGAA